jgi:hypothetical protein
VQALDVMGNSDTFVEQTIKVSTWNLEISAA